MSRAYRTSAAHILCLLFVLQAAAQHDRLADAVRTQVTDDYRALSLSFVSPDSIIAAAMADHHIPGLSACIVKNGEVIWHDAYGYANLENLVPVTDSTLFALASVSKTVTATAVMQLYERGLLALDEDVNDYLPTDLQVVNPSHPTIPITLRMILSHVSSIHDDLPVIDTLTTVGDSPQSLRDVLRGYLVPGGVYYTESSFESYPPATTYDYSNIAVALAGYLVEVVSGSGFATYTEDHIFNPLGMEETAWFLAALDTTHIATAYTYDWGTDVYTAQPHWGHPAYPAGLLRSNSLQLARFLNAFMQKGTLAGTSILDSTTVELMTTIQYPEIPIPAPFPDSSQGLIWFQEYFGERLAWGHSGGWTDGAATAMFYYEPESTGVIVLANRFAGTGVSKIVDALFGYAADIAVGITDIPGDLAPDFRLDQNYPNPFNPSTTISYDLPRAANVTLTVYDVLGRQVRELASGTKPAGTYEVSFDATILPSGVYFYRLEAGDYVETRRMVFVR